MFIHFVKIHKRNRWTDEQTPGAGIDCAIHSIAR